MVVKNLRNILNTAVREGRIKDEDCVIVISPNSCDPIPAGVTIFDIGGGGIHSLGNYADEGYAVAVQDVAEYLKKFCTEKDSTNEKVY